MKRKLDRLNYDIDDENKTLEVEVFQIIEPNEHSDYFWGKYPSKVLEDYRVLHCTTGKPDPTVAHNKILKYIPFVSQKIEQFVILADKEKHKDICKGDKFTAKVRPAWYGTSYPFTILEKVLV